MAFRFVVLASALFMSMVGLECASAAVVHVVRLSNAQDQSNNTSTISTVDTSTGAETLFFSQSGTYLTGLEFDSVGNLFAGDLFNNQILKIAQDGTSTVFATGIDANGFAFDSAGNLYASDVIAGTVTRYAPNGTSTGAFASGLSGPTELGFDSSGNLFIANSGNDTVTKVLPNGTASTFAVTDLDTPEGVAVDASDNLYIANQRNGLPGSTITKFAPDGSGSVFASDLLNGTRGLEFDSDGILYAANNDGSISRYTSDGQATLLVGPGGGTAVSIAFNASSVPEPSMAVAMVIVSGLCAMSRVRSRKRRQTSWD